MKIIYLSEEPCPATPLVWCPASTTPLVILSTALATARPRDQTAPARAGAATVRASGSSLTWAPAAPGSSWRSSSCSSPSSLCRRSSTQQVRGLCPPAYLLFSHHFKGTRTKIPIWCFPPNHYIQSSEISFSQLSKYYCWKKREKSETSQPTSFILNSNSKLSGVKF